VTSPEGSTDRPLAPGPAAPQGPPAAPWPGGPGPTPPAAPDGRRTHRWGLGAFLLAEGVFLLVSWVVGAAVLAQGAPSVAGLGLVLAVPTVVAAAVALAATWLRGHGPCRDLGLWWSWRDVGIGLAFGFGGLFLTGAAALVWGALVGPDATSAVGEVFAGQRAELPVALVILVIVVLVAPLCEEILYRGLLWGALEKLGAGRWIAAGVTTLVFALLHFEILRTPLLLVATIPIALARVHTGRLLASVVAHQVNNLLPGIALVLALTGVVQL